MADQFCKAEPEKNSYLREHQAQLEALDYSRLRKLFGDSGRIKYKATLVRVCRRFTLSSTHVGRVPYMRQQVHGIIAISNHRTFGRLFNYDVQSKLAINLKNPVAAKNTTG